MKKKKKYVYARECRICGVAFKGHYEKKTCSKICANELRSRKGKLSARSIECVLERKGDCVLCVSHKYLKVGYHSWSEYGQRTYLHKVLAGSAGEVRHLCENKWCLNKDHLRIGTHKENMNDAVESGRIAHGTRHGMAKLNPCQAVEIYSLRGSNPSVIAEKYGVTERNIRAIWEGITWWRFTGAKRKISVRDYRAR